MSKDRLMGQQSTPFWALVRASLVSTFGISMLKWRYLKRRERLWEPVLILYAIGTAVAFFGYGLYRVALAIATVGQALNQSEVVLGVGFAGLQSVVLFVGIYWVLSAFFFSKDLNILVPLPLRASDIVRAKFVTVLVGEYITGLFFIVPAVAGYARTHPFGVEKLAVAVLSFFAVPVLPLFVASLIALALMRVINRRHRDRYMILFSILLLFVILGFQALAMRTASSQNPEQLLLHLVGTRFGLLRQVARYFPSALWAALSIHLRPSSEGLLYLALTVGAAAISFWALGPLGERLFMKGLVGGNEEGRDQQRAAARSQALGASLLDAQRPAARAISLREWHIFSRVPVWVLNGLMPALLVPFVLLLPAISSGNTQGFIQFLRNSGARTYVGLAVAALLIFMGTLNTFASTSISREGRRFWISRVIPVPPAAQVRAKMVTAMAVAIASSVPTLVAFALLIRPPIMHVLFPALIGFAGSITGMATGLRIDLARPMLRWEDPQEPVKRNLNAIIPLVVPFVYFLGGKPIAERMVAAGLSPAAIYTVALVLAALPAALLWVNLQQSAEALYRRVED